MARNKGRLTLNQELNRELFNKKRLKYHGKFEDKQADKKLKKESNIEIDKINFNDLQMKKYFHSEDEMNQYKKVTENFCRWGFNKLGKRVPVDSKELISLIPDYIKERIENYSPATVHKDRTALSKIYMLDLTDIKLPTRGVPTKGHTDRSESKRSNWNRTHIDDERVRFWSATGRRREEYTILSKEKTRWIEKKRPTILPKNRDGTCNNIIPIYKDGKVVAARAINTKGGKETDFDIPKVDIEFVTKIFKEGRLNEMLNPTDEANIHDLRRVYARKIYQEYARPLEEIKDEKIKVNINGKWVYRSAVYYCKGKHKGNWFDREAVSKVSKMLGHSDQRCHDVIKYYLL